MTEAIIEPDLPIIDPHHHFWDLRPLMPTFSRPLHPLIETLEPVAYYNFDSLHADLTSGHNVVATVYMECGAFYRDDGDAAMKPVGEVEFANGAAAQGASGLYGRCRPCAAIVGHADLTLGGAVPRVLEALVAAGNGRLRGIRHAGAWDADAGVHGLPFLAPCGLYGSDAFRAGFRHLAAWGLTFDAWVLEPQLPDVIALARAFPEQPIILDHCGTPLNIASYRGRLQERFEVWRTNIRLLAACPNVSIKLGGLGMSFCGMPEQGPAAGLDSAALADLWRPYFETCADAFGADRAMFESNYPVDRWGADYRTLWNVFKRLSATASATEKRALFAGTADRVYGLQLMLAAH